MVGAASRARRAVSPGWFMPSSTTAARWCVRRRNSVSGTPTSLLRLPSVARRSSSPYAAARIAAIISFVVVLPLLPTTTTSGMRCRARQPCARSPSAMRVSSTSTDGTTAEPRPRSTSTAAAPRAATSPRYAWPLKRSPASATKSAPASMRRLSVDTPAMRRTATSSPAPERRPPVSSATSARLITRRTPRPRGARRSAVRGATPRPRRRRRRTRAAFRRSPGRPRGPCPR